mmetsp:Transcript_6564/g.17611  ORF Transcript_6564/g.17611 Transcript_6564/m.17611 type:complete len:416 (-) Transcript_6564:277-1524(-)
MVAMVDPAPPVAAAAAGGGGPRRPHKLTVSRSPFGSMMGEVGDNNQDSSPRRGLQGGLGSQGVASPMSLLNWWGREEQEPTPPPQCRTQSPWVGEGGPHTRYGTPPREVCPSLAQEDADDNSECVKLGGQDFKSTEDRFRAMQDVYRVPAYPLMGNLELKFSGESIGVCEHLGEELGDTRCIVIFLPGVYGGVGPCRKPGADFDDNALYPLVARGKVSKGSIDCYRLSWKFMQPDMLHAVGGTCHVVYHAVRQAAKRYRANGLEPPSTISVVFVGHSLGGAVAVHAAEVLGRHYGEGGQGNQGGRARARRGSRGSEVCVAGVCTLNSAMDRGAAEMTSALTNTRAMMICGASDKVISPRTTESLFRIFPSDHKKFVELPNGTHDLYAYKDVLVAKVSDFIIEVASGQSSALLAPP